MALPRQLIASGGRTLIQQRDSLPSLWEVMLLAERSVDHNVAVVAGASSGHVRAINIDRLDAELSERLRDLAFEIFGETPFVGIGHPPHTLTLCMGDKGRAATDVHIEPFKDGDLEALAIDEGQVILFSWYRLAQPEADLPGPLLSKIAAWPSLRPKLIEKARREVEVLLDVGFQL